jgi:hypothetical protein
MVDSKKPQRSVTQQQVLKWFDGRFPRKMQILPKRKGNNDNCGPDRTLKRNGKMYCFEAIAFSHRTASGRLKKWKNQADFWKAFSQAISRFNPQSEWDVPDVSVILLPWQFSVGWQERVDRLGKDIWMRIARAFPELEVWFISHTKYRRFSWSKASNAFPRKKGR